MAENTAYITAGLPVAKNSGQSPDAGVNTVFITAGLPPEVLDVAPPTGFKTFWIPKRQHTIGGGIT
jgi:hypothetical protein